MHDLTIYTAEPGSTAEERLKLLASWRAISPAATTGQVPER